MTICVNGVAREVDDGITLAQLLKELGAPQDGVAVAVDNTVVPRGAYANELRNGARIEIIRAVGGG